MVFVKTKQNGTCVQSRVHTHSYDQHGVYFVLANGSWAWVWWSIVTPLRNSFFLLLSKYRLDIASRLGVGAFVHFPRSVLGSCARILSVLDLCRPCMNCHILCAFICASVVFSLKDIDSLEASSTSGSYNLSTFLFLSLERRVWWKHPT